MDSIKEINSNRFITERAPFRSTADIKVIDFFQNRKHLKWKQNEETPKLQWQWLFSIRILIDNLSTKIKALIRIFYSFNFILLVDSASI